MKYPPVTHAKHANANNTQQHHTPRVNRSNMKAAAAMILALMGPGLSDGKAVPVTKLDPEAYSGRWFQM